MSLQRRYELFKICCTWKKECYDPNTEGHCPSQVPGVGWWPGSLSKPLWPSPPACCSWWSVPTSPASTPRSHPGLPQSAWSWYGVYMFSILPTNRTIMALNWWKQLKPILFIGTICLGSFSAIDVSSCDQYLWAVCSYVFPSFFSSCPLLQRSCSPDSRPQQATTTPTNCTPWRTRGRRSWTIISLRSRCMSSLGLTWPEDCHHVNSLSPSLTQLELEVRPSDSWPSLTCCNRKGERQWARGAIVYRLCEVVATFSRRPEANDLVKLCWFALHIGAATYWATTQLINWLWSSKSPFAEWLPLTSWPLFHSLCSPVAYC